MNSLKTRSFVIYVKIIVIKNLRNFIKIVMFDLQKVFINDLFKVLNLCYNNKKTN